MQCQQYARIMTAEDVAFSFGTDRMGWNLPHGQARNLSGASPAAQGRSSTAFIHRCTALFPGRCIAGKSAPVQLPSASSA
jgi:hypothetical protein